MSFISDSNTILVASSSQDSYIRLWRISPRLEGEQTPTGIIAVEQKLFTAFGRQWSVKLEAVLGGHEGWVYGIQWDWPVLEGGMTTFLYKKNGYKHHQGILHRKHEFLKVAHYHVHVTIK